jgi:type II secretory pathway component PulK
MNKKAQTLMIGLWILAILTILAVGIGHRVSLALRISRYHRDSLKAHSLAKAGVNLAIAELDKDANDYDAPSEKWANNEITFKKVALNDNPDEYATISYTYFDEDNNPRTVYGARDLESRININTASKELLLALLEKYEIKSAQEIVNNILIWRGDIPDENKIYENSGYPCKSGIFSNIEELNLVKDFTQQDYQKIENLITVFGEGLMNINTVSNEAMAILAHSIAKKLSVAQNFADSLATKILELRKSNGYFKDKSEINIMLSAEETNIFNLLIDSMVYKSDYFLIEVTGNSSRIKRKAEAVYFRKDKKILDWHES